MEVKKYSFLALLQQFKKHIIPLLVTGYVRGIFQYTIYSGFFLDCGGTLIWLTAGHVVDEFKVTLTSTNFKQHTIAWLDGYEDAMAKSVPLHSTEIPLKSWLNEGLDVGAIRLSFLDAGNILKNRNVEPVNSLVWKNLKQATPEGYYAIGFPSSIGHYSKQQLSTTKTKHSIQPNYVCLPLIEIPPPIEFIDDPIWSNPEAFYGKIQSYIDDKEFDIEEAKGMSGGPILSIERNPDGPILLSFGWDYSIFC